MKTSTSGEKHEMQWTARMRLDDLDFADELTLLSQTQQQMQEKTASVAAISAAVGLNVHKGKSKILQYNTTCTSQITIDGEDLEDVSTFTFLGSITDEHGVSDADTSTSEGKRGVQWTSRMQLNDLDFADDLALLSQTQQQMQGKTTSVAAVSAAIGLNIHKEKRKIL
ncbi:unnamed protein product [Schistosoma margrebowiei]|uniref:Uncharacterized protein n=1 Tax=Schistosoma margrebowiei TaxID=48269 RepID=A0A183LFJ7_9TREM|nr:unnamed protein product [Schistosoma margrebowiei]